MNIKTIAVVYIVGIWIATLIGAAVYADGKDADGLPLSATERLGRAVGGAIIWPILLFVVSAAGIGEVVGKRWLHKSSSTQDIENA